MCRTYKFLVYWILYKKEWKASKVPKHYSVLSENFTVTLTIYVISRNYIYINIIRLILIWLFCAALFTMKKLRWLLCNFSLELCMNRKETQGQMTRWVSYFARTVGLIFSIILLSITYDRVINCLRRIIRQLPLNIYIDCPTACGVWLLNGGCKAVPWPYNQKEPFCMWIKPTKFPNVKRTEFFLHSHYSPKVKLLMLTVWGEGRS